MWPLGQIPWQKPFVELNQSGRHNVSNQNADSSFIVKHNQADSPSVNNSEGVRNRGNLFYIASLERSNPVSVTDYFLNVENEDIPQNRHTDIEQQGSNPSGPGLESGLSEFAKSFYETIPLQRYEYEMGRNPPSNKGKRSPSKRQGVSFFGKARLGQQRKAIKRQSEGEDSVIILSPSSEPESTPRSGNPGGGGHYRSLLGANNNIQVQKRIRLFDASGGGALPGPSSTSSGNVTIDLLDDDDDKSPTKQEIIVLSDDDSSRESTSAMPKINTTLEEGEIRETANEEVEIVAVHVVAPNTQKTPNTNTRKNATRKSIRSSVVRSGKRRTSFSYRDVQLAVARAKKRSSFGIAKTSALSHTIKKKKNKKKGTKGQVPSISQSPFRNRKAKIIQRRATNPVFLLNNELGPANPNFIPLRPGTSTWAGFRPPVFIPLEHARFAGMRFQNPLFPLPGGNFNFRLPNPMPSIPAEPNFLSVSDNENSSRVPGSLRPIIIDGSNVAMGHRNDKTFSCRGIQICVEFFKRRGHEEVLAFVPQFRRKPSESTDTKILEDMEKQGVVKFTPSREVDGQRIAAYDDRFIVQYAHIKDGIIISNDNFRDIFKENESWRDTIRYRILQFTWADENCIMFPHDPLGRNGPTLDTFLRF